MITVILAVALLVTAVAGLVEIGIASWNIRRAGRYRRREATAEIAAKSADFRRQEMADQVKSLDDYASKISWLLNFLYKRYDKFNDLENEIEHGLSNVNENTSIGEVDDRYQNLKKALKIIRVTVKASERMESIITQIRSIAEDFQNEDEESTHPESPKEEPAKAETSAE